MAEPILQPASYCQNCKKYTVCKITSKIATMDLEVAKFNEDNKNYPLKMKVVSVAYDCKNKETITTTP